MTVNGMIAFCLVAISGICLGFLFDYFLGGPR